MIGRRGHWQYVFESINDVPQVRITAVSSGCEDSAEVMETRCIEYGFEPKVYTDWREMLERENPRLVCIDGPFHLHAEMCVEALKRNIHVFCEKPIAITLEQLDAVEQALAAGSARIYSMVALRYEPAFQTAIDFIRKGGIGKVKIISARKSYKLGKRPEFFKRRSTYGGTIPWVGSHAIDWIMSIADSKVKRVWAVQSHNDNFDHGELEISASCLLEMTNGIHAQASIDYLRPAASPTHGDDRVRIAGTRGVIDVDRGRIQLIDKDGEREIAPTPGRRIFSDIVLDIENIRESLVDSRQTIELTRACLCAQLAADENRLVDIP
jgi:predicted dehydrogenase